MIFLKSDINNKGALLITVLSVFFAMLPGVFSILFYLLLFCVILFKYNYSPIVFFILGAVLVGNELLFASVIELSILKYLLIFSFFLMTVRQRLNSSYSNKMIVYLILIFCLILAHSLFFSQILSLSLLKLINWFLFIFSMFCFFSNLDDEIRLKIMEGLNIALSVLIVCSLPLLGIPEIGYLRNGMGFQGFTNQPQAFGSFVGVFAILNLLLFFKNKKLHYIAFFSLGIFLIILSQSRTAGLAYVLSFATILTMIFLSRYQRFFVYNFSRNSIYYVFFLILIMPLIIIFNINYLFDYINKRGSSAIEEGETSRSSLISNMMNNINSYFAEGIGFGLPSDLDLSDASYLPLLNLPISVPTEKGVLYIAIFEELGVLFGFFVIILILLISFHRFNSNVYLPIIVFVLGTNIAENTFFSIGGVGLMLSIFYIASVKFKKLN